MRTGKATLGHIKRKIAGTKIINDQQDKKQPTRSWLEVLTDKTDISKDSEYRVAMTVSCRDSDYIPKVKNAGQFKTIDGTKYQIMHNGIIVESGGYFGDWMAEIITSLKGHHEPQEEKIFYELLQRLQPGATMIELGSYWAYYSIWFNHSIKDATNYCCEPDPENIELGKRNSKINKTNNMHFMQTAAGKEDGIIIDFQPQENITNPTVSVPIRSIDKLITEKLIEKFDIVHMDVQGVELDALKGAEQSIRDNRVRFVIVSTHHYAISQDVRIHEKCLDYITSLGGHIIAEHAIHESFSGDGLIVASFFEEDKDFTVDISVNRMADNLFRSYTKDLEILINEYENLRKLV
jgi:FkbM family methyltransferase